MYIHHIYSRAWINRVRRLPNLACGQLNRGTVFFPVLIHAPHENLNSRDGFGRPVQFRVSLLILHAHNRLNLVISSLFTISIALCTQVFSAPRFLPVPQDCAIFSFSKYSIIVVISSSPSILRLSVSEDFAFFAAAVFCNNYDVILPLLCSTIIIYLPPLPKTLVHGDVRRHQQPTQEIIMYG